MDIEGAIFVGLMVIGVLCYIVDTINIGKLAYGGAK